MKIIDKPQNKFKRYGIGLLVLGFLLGTFLLYSNYNNQADAADATKFNPGNIISDSVFYNHTTMTVSDIQSFLNGKVSSCESGYTCLKNYSAATVTKSADAYCSGYTASSSQTAAQIIYGVSQSCKINPQVLIVLLQKEMGLVTHTGPGSWRYDKAAGFACPDSGACDTQYYGLFNQLYHAARQYRVYQAKASSYNYIAGRNNTILYNPSASCGTSTVYIENQATAGLYNYTPYRPNQAALDAGYGTGDSCSSYGNRNFWLYFTDWFGGTIGPEYAWQYVSQDFFVDQAMTTKFSPGTIVVEPGQKIYVRVVAKNVGRKAWSQSNVRLGAFNNQDRSSVFYDASWINNQRTSSIKETTVPVNENGTFEFVLAAPQATNLYKEYFNIVADGESWFNDVGLNFPIHVVTRRVPTEDDYSKAILQNGETLQINDYRLSPEKNSVLVLQEDGNLVYYTNYQAAWNSGTSGQKADHLTMQDDGNLVLYDKDNICLWKSDTAGNTGAYLRLQTDGNLVIYNNNGQAVWHIDKYQKYPDNTLYTNDTLPAGKRLYPGQSLISKDGNYEAVLQQHDGNLVLYSNIGQKHYLWASFTNGQKIKYLINQTDGNLVLYAKTGPAVWHTSTYANAERKSHLVMQSDGNLVLYRDDIGSAVWHTSTYGKK